MSGFFAAVIVPTNDLRIALSTAEQLVMPYWDDMDLFNDERLDYYGLLDGAVLGGSYDGKIRGYSRRAQPFHYGSEYSDADLRHNICPVGERDRDATPYAVVTPDGMWHQPCNLYTPSPACDVAWEKWLEYRLDAVFAPYEIGHLVVGFGCHI